MNNWNLLNVRYLSGGSLNSDNMGQTPLTAKYKKTFFQSETGELRDVTDLQSKRYRRDNSVKLFFGVYNKRFVQKSHSVLCAVVDQSEYPTVTKFINTLTRKLKRKGVDRLGYVWFRDVGDEVFHKHYHVIIATTRINADLFNELFCKKKHNRYDVEFLKSPKGITKYITDKELYAANRQRSYGKSRLFPEKLKKSNE